MHLHGIESVRSRFSARIDGAFLLLFVIVGALMAAVPSSAAAARHPSEGVLGTAAQPSFGRAAGSAVDAAGNVLVIDMSTQTVRRFKPDGTPANFSALGTNVIDGNSGLDETPQGTVLTSFGNANEVGVAVDTSGGVANGDIYVTDSRSNGVVDIFSPTGEYLGQLTEFGGTLFGETLGVAVDSGGAVYISDYGNGVQTYAPSANPATNADFVETFATGTTGLNNPAAIAAGKGTSAGSLFVDSYSEGTVTKISSSTGAFEDLISESATPNQPNLVAVDPTTGHVYYSQGPKVFEVDANGVTHTRISTITAGSTVEGLSVNASGQIYLSRSSREQVEVYGPLASPVPFLESQSVLAVSGTEATLEAQINPEGFATSFRVDYGPTAAYGASTPAAGVGSDETSHSVQVQIKNLTPGTEYHFRFVATNVTGTTEGTDQTFETTRNLSAPQTCPNEAFRVGPSARLSSCRAYEMVSPVDKGGLNIEPALTLFAYRTALYQVATSGNALTYATAQGFSAPEGGPYAQQYLATRTGAGWNSISVAPSQNRTRSGQASDRIDLEYRAFSSDLCTGALLNWSEPPLVAPAVNGAPNIYARTLCGGGLSAVSITSHFAQPEVGGISSDGRCVLYFPNRFTLIAVRSEGKEDPGGLYELCGNDLSRIDLLPDGTPTQGFVIPGTRGQDPPELMLRESILEGAFSEDASTVYWTDNAGNGVDPGAGQLFVRINSRSSQSALGPANECLEPTKACTLPVSAPVEAGVGPANFGAASRDGSRAYYYMAGGPLVGNLYEFDLASRSSRLIGTDLAVSGSQPLAPVLGASADGSRVYFFSTAALGGEGVNGDLNLYLFEAASAAATGSTRLVATMPLASNTREFEYSPVQRPTYRSARITPDGLHAVFTSDQPLTGYDNRAQGSGEPAVEVYLYDALANSGHGHLTCVSCNPSGRRPEAGPILRERNNNAPSETEFAGLIPGYYTSLHGARVISDDGSRVFFESFDPLIPQDTNGKVVDVYEWKREGVSGCTAQSSSYSPVNDGCLALVSSGQSSSNSRLIDATSDGRDVFISTLQSLVPQDPGLVDIYDARIDGGFAASEGSQRACEGDACQSPPPAPTTSQSGSTRFSGPGNQHPKCSKSKKHGKKPCKRKAKQKGKNQKCHKGRTPCKRHTNGHKQKKNPVAASKGGSK